MNIYQSLAIIATLLWCCQGQKLANIDYLGTGYDIIFGNPHNHLYDPGKIKLLNESLFLGFLIWVFFFFYAQKYFSDIIFIQRSFYFSFILSYLVSYSEGDNNATKLMQIE